MSLSKSDLLEVLAKEENREWEEVGEEGEIMEVLA